MAYRRKPARRSYSRGRSYPAGTRRSYARKRTPSRRRTASRGRSLGGSQTIRLELVQAPAGYVTRPSVFSPMVERKRKNTNAKL